jgi:hypothetical protein
MWADWQWHYILCIDFLSMFSHARLHKNTKKRGGPSVPLYNVNIMGGPKNSFFHLKLIEKMSFYLNFRATRDQF